MREAVKDPAHLSLIMSSGRYGYIDPSGKEIIPDEYYWAANGDRINIPGYKSEMDAFSARFGKLYEKAEYIGT